MIDYSSTAKFVDTFLTKVDPLPIAGLQTDLQWVSRLALHKASGRKEFEKFCAGMLEVVLARTDAWDTEMVEQVDAILRPAGCFTLSELRGKGKKALLRIIKHSKIRSESDYHLVRSAVDDSAGSISPALRNELEHLLVNFEEGR